MDKEKIIEEVAKIIREHLDKEYKIYLFGSWVKGEALETSDLDVGILGEEKVNWETLVKIKSKAEAIQTLRKIDVVDLKTIEDFSREKILETAKLLE